MVVLKKGKKDFLFFERKKKKITGSTRQQYSFYIKNRSNRVTERHSSSIAQNCFIIDGTPIWAPKNMGNMGAHIAHILFFGVPILAAAHMGVPSMFHILTILLNRRYNKGALKMYPNFFQE